jgi:ABC-2 type transport system permease protein/lipopolysaccharide transport system permease protein
MLHPLLSMTVLALVFSTLLRIQMDHYALFLFCGLLPWNYLNSTILMSLDSIRSNSRIFSQVPVPKYIFVLSIALSNFINLLFALVPLIVLMLVMKHPLHLTALSFPIVIIPVLFTTIGISLALAALNVFFGDIRHLTEVALGLLYFLSPIIYDRSMLPESFHKWLAWNPLLYQIEQLRGVCFDGKLPFGGAFCLSLGFSSLILICGLLVFKRAEDKFLYYV